MTDSASVETSERLLVLAQRLREADHLEPDAQRELADLVDELSKVLDTTRIPASEIEHISETVDHLESHLLTEQSKDASVDLTIPEQAMVRLEARSPMLAGIVRRLINVLSGIGI